MSDIDTSETHRPADDPADCPRHPRRSSTPTPTPRSRRSGSSSSTRSRASSRSRSTCASAARRSRCGARSRHAVPRDADVPSRSTARTGSSPSRPAAAPSGQTMTTRVVMTFEAARRRHPRHRRSRPASRPPRSATSSRRWPGSARSTASRRTSRAPTMCAASRFGSPRHMSGTQACSTSEWFTLLTGTQEHPQPLRAAVGARRPPAPVERPGRQVRDERPGPLHAGVVLGVPEVLGAVRGAARGWSPVRRARSATSPSSPSCHRRNSGVVRQRHVHRRRRSVVDVDGHVSPSLTLRGFGMVSTCSAAAGDG